MLQPQFMKCSQLHAAFADHACLPSCAATLPVGRARRGAGGTAPAQRHIRCAAGGAQSTLG